MEVAKPVCADVQRAAAQGGIAVGALYPRDAGSHLRTSLTSADLALVVTAPWQGRWAAAARCSLLPRMQLWRGLIF